MVDAGTAAAASGCPARNSAIKWEWERRKRCKVVAAIKVVATAVGKAAMAIGTPGNGPRYALWSAAMKGVATGEGVAAAGDVDVLGKVAGSKRF